MKILKGALSLFFFGIFLEFNSSANCSENTKKKRDKPRSGSLGSSDRSRRSISVVDVEFDRSTNRVTPLERDESNNSLNEMATGPHAHLRPNKGTFDDCPTRFHILAPLRPTDTNEIGDYREFFPDIASSPIDLDEQRRRRKLNARKLQSSTSSSSSSSSSSSTSSSGEEKSRKQRRRGNSKSSLEKKKKDKKKDKKK